MHPPSTRHRRTPVTRPGSSQALLRHSERHRGELLPSGPDSICGAPLRRTQPSTPGTGPNAQRAGPQVGVQPLVRGLRMQGTTSSPPSTVRLMSVVPERSRSTAPVRSMEGGMRERPNRHAWKACVGKLTLGSNPSLSAKGVRASGTTAGRFSLPNFYNH